LTIDAIEIMITDHVRSFQDEVSEANFLIRSFHLGPTIQRRIVKTTARKVLLRTALVTAMVGVAVSMAGCSSPSNANTKSSDPILVWADATREPAFKAYEKAHPDVKLKVEIVDPAALLSKIQLANRVGKGWPDVIFDPQPTDVASLSSPLFNYAQRLDDLIPKDVQKNFATGNKACTIDGKLYCLQNDLAQGVLWYNKPLMDQFGYSVPTTWDQFKQLGEKVAAEHPGYVLGAAGDVNIWYDYLWSSGCPLADVKSSTQVHINTSDKACTRVADTIDPLLQNGSVSRLSPFDPKMIKTAQDGKLLMTIGPSWFGEYVLHAKTSYNLPDGEIAAAPMPTWQGATANYSGAWGGGIYIVSSHAADKKTATDIAQWVATNDAYQATAPTYPAYKPAATTWAQSMSTSKFYAANPVPVLTDAADKINPAVGPTRYALVPTVTSTVVAAIKAGGTIASALPGLQDQLSALAQSAGYEVVK
jgi:ABC-type glycerol-3-phosphate transport system substrate-binding protein